jgi:hypothetical protein
MTRITFCGAAPWYQWVERVYAAHRNVRMYKPDTGAIPGYSDAVHAAEHTLHDRVGLSIDAPGA